MIGGTKHFLILKISIKSVWMFLWWLQTSLLFCNNVSKSLSWSLSITLSALSCTLFITFTARKTLFSFSKYSKKMLFPKKLHWNMIFLVSSAKMVFLFSKNMTLFFRRKMKDDLSQKIPRNMIYSSNILKRWSFQKYRTEIWSFFYHKERWHFFFPKIWYVFYGRKMKDGLSQKIRRSMMFSICSVKVVFLFPTNMKSPFWQKSKDDLFQKNTPKDDISGITEKDNINPRKDNIGILGLHSRKSSNDSLYFYRDLNT